MRDISPMHFMDLAVANLGPGAGIGQSGTVAVCTDLVAGLRVSWVITPGLDTVTGAPVVRFTGAPSELQEVLRRYDLPGPPASVQHVT